MKIAIIKKLKNSQEKSNQTFFYTDESMATLKKTKKIISILTHDFTIVFCFSLFVIVHCTCVHVYMHAYKHMVQNDDDDEKKIL